MMVWKKIIPLFIQMVLFLILLAGTIASGVSAVITVIPDAFASKVSMLGYKSHCSFTPISTAILVVMTLILGFIFFRLYGKRILQIIGNYGTKNLRIVNN